MAISEKLPSDKGSNDISIFIIKQHNKFDFCTGHFQDLHIVEPSGASKK